ncbi:MAG: chromosome condensation regulator, partial [Holophagales bacterium]|nr:chromosome condensation regulator [Holophagales bacterium]
EPMPMSSCGDGILDPGEACDDGDDDDADGCTKLCTTTELIGLSTSINNTCVILSGGTVRCWGSGDLAQLGVPGLTEPIGDDELPSSIPPIQLGGAAVQLASGANHNCAQIDNGDLRCWGFSNYGQLGLGNMLSIGDNEHPASVGPVMIGGPIQSVAATTNHSCAALVNGDVRCWGYYTDGNLGYGKFGNIGDNEVPSTQAAVKLGEPATAVAVGEVHSCALLASKTVRCWGTNLSGQLGLGMPVVIGDNDHPIDYPKIIFTDVEAIAASRHHTCVLQTGGVVRCFGDNNYGQLGYGHTNRIGDNESPDVGPVNLGGKAIKIDCGINVTCALLEGGDVRCWGRNNYGQLGLANKNNVGDDELPIDVPVINLGGKALDIDSSGYHTCAVIEGGGLRCWGYPSASALGYGEIVILGDDEHPADIGFVEIF